MKNKIGPNTTLLNRGHHRLKSHQKLNISLHLEDINNFKKETEIFHKKTNYIKEVKSLLSGKITTYKNFNEKKSNIRKKNKMENEENSFIQEEYKHVRFGEKSVDNKILKIKPEMKKTKSSLILPNMNDIYNKSKSKEKDKKNNRYISESKKSLSRSLKLEKKPKNYDEEWDIDKYCNLGKMTIDINERKKLYKFSSEKSSINYINSTQSKSVAGKDSGMKKINQDSFISEKNINGILNFNMFGVLDGHGTNGHYASQFAKKYIVNKIKNIPLVKNLAKPKEIYRHLIGNDYKIITDIFIESDIQIRKEKFNCENSGTTCVIVLQFEENLICANAGDSRAILIYDEKNDEKLKRTKIFPLSYDSKPQNPSERKRITERGGVVLQDLDENGIPEGPYRVWVKGENYPGIAISRSIGDTDAKEIGVIPNPQIIEYKISPKSKYMIICSDGIWEYISNEQAMKIGNNYYLKKDALGLCNELIKKSTDIWDKEGMGDVDDITVVVVFF